VKQTKQDQQISRLKKSIKRHNKGVTNNQHKSNAATYARWAQLETQHNH